MTDSELRILGRIEGTLESLVSLVERNHQEQRDTAHSHSKRLRTLENWRWYLLGSFATIAFILKSL